MFCFSTVPEDSVFVVMVGAQHLWQMNCAELPLSDVMFLLETPFHVINYWQGAVHLENSRGSTSTGHLGALSVLGSSFWSPVKFSISTAMTVRIVVLWVMTAVVAEDLGSSVCGITRRSLQWNTISYSKEFIMVDILGVLWNVYPLYLLFRLSSDINYIPDMYWVVWSPYSGRDQRTRGKFSLYLKQNILSLVWLTIYTESGLVIGFIEH
jgi:hypothetical protein